MQFELLTLHGATFEGQAQEVGLRTSEGSMAILPHHEPFTAIVLPGPVSVLVNNKTELYATFGGIVEVTDNRVRLLADEAEHSDVLIESEIEEALARAKTLRDNAKDKGEMHRAQQLVDRQAVRLEVAHVRRRRNSQH